MPSYPVKFYTSTMEGAPTLGTAFGELTNLLDKCIVTGFGTKNITAITNNGSVATVYFGTTHGYLQHQIIKIEGANESGYNGEQRVTSIAPTSLTFNIASGVPSPATGDLICSIPPLGFEISYTGTNKRIYRSTNVNSNRFYLRVDDSQAAGYTSTYAKKGKVTVLRKDPTHVDGPYQNGVFDGMQMPYDSTNPSKNHMPSSSGATIVDGWAKWYYSRSSAYSNSDSTTTTAGNHAWTIIGDDRGFYLCLTEEASAGSVVDSDVRGIYCFTDFDSYIPGDAANTILTASEYNSAANTTFGTGYNGPGKNTWYTTMVQNGKWIMANHTGYGLPTNTFFIITSPYDGRTASATGSFKSGYDTNNVYPLGPGYGIFLTQVWLRQSATPLASNEGIIRGVMPGMRWVIGNVQNSAVLLGNEILENVAGQSDKKFLCIKWAVHDNATNTALNPGRILFDITGPWH